MLHHLNERDFHQRLLELPSLFTKQKQTNATQRDESTKASDNLNRQCSIHILSTSYPHPLRKCRGFRENTLQERENLICFRCCSSTTHQANDCKAVIQCSECNSDKHIAALHKGPAPWLKNEDSNPSTNYGGEREEPPSPIATSTCTEVCGDHSSRKSCSKICLVNVYPKGEPQNKQKVYAIIDDQSNRSLAISAFFEMLQTIRHLTHLGHVQVSQKLKGVELKVLQWSPLMKIHALLFNHLLNATSSQTTEQRFLLQRQQNTTTT